MVDELWQLEDDPTPTTSVVNMGGVRTGGPQDISPEEEEVQCDTWSAVGMSVRVSVGICARLRYFTVTDY